MTKDERSKALMQWAAAFPYLCDCGPQAARLHDDCVNHLANLLILLMEK